MDALRLLHQKAPPRIAAAALRTMWNGWPTLRRFQKEGPCLFMCGNWIQEDSIEHYACCHTALDFGRRILNIRRKTGDDHKGNLVTFGLNSATRADDEIIRRAIWNYSLYRSLCELRHKPLNSAIEVFELMKQFSKEGVRGHSTATDALDNVWMNNRSPHQDDFNRMFDDVEEWA